MKRATNPTAVMTPETALNLQRMGCSQVPGIEDVVESVEHQQMAHYEQRKRQEDRPVCTARRAPWPLGPVRSRP